MGAAISTSVASSVQTATNRTYQSAEQECSADCNQLISGNVIVLEGVTAGDITFTQRCTAEASCYMKNAVDTAVTAFQQSSVSADAAPALFPGIQVNTTVSSNRQDITNELTQILENLCTADVNQTIQDNIVYATDSTIGNIGFLQEGNASADCVMENSARLQLQMRQEGDTTARAGNTLSFISGIISLVIIIVIIIIVATVIRKAAKQGGPPGSPFGGGGFGGGQAGGQQAGGQRQTQSQTQTGGQGGFNLQSVFGQMGGQMGGQSGGKSGTTKRSSTGTRSRGRK